MLDQTLFLVSKWN